MTARSDLMDALDTIRKRVRSGDIESIAIVVIGPECYEVAYLGEPQAMGTLHGAGLALMAHVHEVIENDGEPLVEGVKDAEDGASN